MNRLGGQDLHGIKLRLIRNPFVLYPCTILEKEQRVHYQKRSSALGYLISPVLVLFWYRIGTKVQELVQIDIPPESVDCLLFGISRFFLTC